MYLLMNDCNFTRTAVKEYVRLFENQKHSLRGVSYKLECSFSDCPAFGNNLTCCVIENHCLGVNSI